MKLDAKFYGTISKAKDSSLVHEDEWMLFLAKDNAFNEILPLYRDKCIELGCDQEQIEAVNRAISRVKEWRSNNKDRIKNPDAKDEKLLDTKEILN